MVRDLTKPKTTQAARLSASLKGQVSKKGQAAVKRVIPIRHRQLAIEARDQIRPDENMAERLRMPNTVLS